MAPYDATSPCLPPHLPARDVEWHDNKTLSEVCLPPNPQWSIDVGDCQGARRRVIREGEAIEVGTAHAADLRLDDRTVSGRHCVLWVDGGRLRFSDNGSRNGTYAGGSRVLRGEIVPGGALVVGRTVLTFSPQTNSEPDDVATEAPLAGLVGESLPMRQLAREVRQLAPLRVPVLVRGETGSGKELVAKALHDESARRAQPFVPLNMGALPVELADSELFGHERGAFTGAVASRLGAFELARNGTLFLDEIAELPLPMQAKLLRALEGGEIRVVGGGQSRRVEVRIVAATWAPLEDRVAQGTFREDLFHRLAVLPIYLPPLRERKADIPLLASCFLASSEVGPRTLSTAALSGLIAHTWPGNVRELRNVLLRAATLSRETQISSETIHASLARSPSMPPPRSSHVATPQPTYGNASSFPPPPPSSPMPMSPRHRATEIKHVLAANQGNVSATAREMGISRATVRTWGR
jgi:DNA-binding NtrC family response regulator